MTYQALRKWVYNIYRIFKTAAYFMNQWLFLPRFEGGKEQIFPRFLWSISYVACHVIRNSVSLSIYHSDQMLAQRKPIPQEPCKSLNWLTIQEFQYDALTGGTVINLELQRKGGFPLPFERSEKVPNKIAMYAHSFYSSHIKMPAGLIVRECPCPLGFYNFDCPHENR